MLQWCHGRVLPVLPVPDGHREPTRNALRGGWGLLEAGFAVVARWWDARGEVAGRG